MFKVCVKALSLAAFFATAPAVQSGIPVIDSANLVQAIATVNNAIQQLSALRNQINNQVNMINLQQTNLRRLPHFIDGDITVQLNAWRNILANTRGILENANAMVQEYDEVFGSTGSNIASVVADVTGRLRQVDASALNALEAIAMLNLDQDRDAINHVMSSAQSASGHLQALQALSQFNAIATRQFSQSNVLLSRQTELLAIDMARATAETRQMTGMQQRLNRAFTVRAVETRVVIPSLK